MSQVIGKTLDVPIVLQQIEMYVVKVKKLIAGLKELKTQKMSLDQRRSVDRWVDAKKLFPSHSRNTRVRRVDGRDKFDWIHHMERIKSATQETDFNRDIIPFVNQQCNWGDEYLQSRGLHDAQLASPLPELDANEKVQFHLSSCILDLIDDIAYLRSSGRAGPHIRRTSDGLFIFIEECVILCLDDDWTVGSWPYFLMCAEHITQRPLVIYGAKYLFPEESRLVPSIIYQFAIQDALIKTYSDEGYALVKSPETLCRPYLTYLTSPESRGPNDTWTEMCSKVREKEREISGKGSPIMDRYIDYLLTIRSIRVVVELFGLIKSSGFPIVDPIRGAESARKHAVQPDSSEIHANYEVSWMLRDIFLRGYLTEHAAWPPLRFLRTGTKLEALSLEGKPIIIKGDYPLSDWQTCEFIKCMDFNYFDSFLELLDDKAAAPLLNEAIVQSGGITFDDCCPPDQKTYLSKHDLFARTTSNRLILEMLSKKEVDTELIAEVGRKDLWPAKHRAIKLNAKEKEFKLEPRMFCTLTAPVRMYMSMTQHNVKKAMKYVPQQTMTMSRLDLIKRFDQDSKLFDDPRVVKLFVEVDLTRWNLLWRDLCVRLCARVLNEMFGLPGMFTNVHQFFESCRVYTTGPGITMTPVGYDFKDQPGSWRGHKGGFEGIAQKVWTLCTVACVELALRDLDVEFSLSGQGDNQVLTLTTACEPDEREKTYQLLEGTVLDKICATFSRVGQIVKRSECVVSRTVITYGKKFWVRGIPFDPVLKAYARTCLNGSDTVVAQSAQIEAIQSHMLSCSDNYYQPIRFWALGQFLSQWTLVRLLRLESPGRRKRFTESNCWFISRGMSSIPTKVGGLCAVGLASYLSRGEADPLSTAIMSVRMSLGPMGDQYLGYLCGSNMYNPNPDVSGLILDPFSIPIMYVASSDPKRQLVKSAITAVTTNRDVRDLIIVSSGGDDRRLLDMLANLRPMIPIVYHDIYDSSAAGAARDLLAGLENTYTLKKMAVSTEDRGLIQKVHRRDNEMINEFASNLSWARLYKCTAAHMSAFELAECYRKFWKVGDLTGVTTHHPLDTHFTETGFDNSGVQIQYMTENTDLCHTTRGPFKPYYGSRTAEKRGDYGIKVITDNPTAKSVKKLLLIRSQVISDGSVDRLIEQCVSQRMAVPYEVLKIVMPHVFGGIAAHRYDAMQTRKHFGQNGNWTHSFHAMVSTDHCEPLSGSTDDYPLALQEWITVGLGLLGSLNYRRKGPKGVCLLLPEMKPLTSSVVQSIGPDKRLLTMPRIENKLLFSGDLLCELASTKLPSAYTRRPSHSRKELLAAMRFLLLEALESQASIKHALLTDDLPKRTVEIDLTELIGAGIDTMIELSGEAVAMTAARVYHTRITGERQLSLSALVSRLSAFVVLPWSNQLFHPSLRALKATREHDLVMGVGGSGHVYALAKLNNLVVSAAERALGHVDMPLLVVPLASPSMPPSKYLFSILVLRIHARIAGYDRHTIREISPRIDHSLREIQQSLRHGQSEMDRITSLQAAASVSIPAAPLIAVVYKELMRKPLVQLNVPILEYVRRLRASSNKPTGPPIHRKQFRPVKLTTSPVQIIRTGTREYKRSSNWDVRDTILRALSRPEHAFSSLELLWEEVLLKLLPSSVALNDTHVIGAGAGSCMAALLELGAYKVTGHELIGTLPKLEHRYLSYLPPRVARRSDQDRAKLSSAMLRMGGDWFSYGPKELKEFDGASLVILDIEPDRQFSLSWLSNLCQSAFSGWVVFKVRLSPVEYMLMEGDILASFGSYRVVEHRDPAGKNPTRYYAVHLRERTRLAIGSIHIHTDKVTMVSNPEEADIGHVYLVLGGPLPFHEVTDTGMRRYEQMLKSIGDATVKTIHHSVFSRGLECLFFQKLVLMMVEESDERIVEVLAELLTCDILNVDVSGRKYTTPVVESTRLSLSRAIPSIIGILKRDRLNDQSVDGSFYDAPEH
jgi:hypothetical protein